MSPALEPDETRSIDGEISHSWGPVIVLTPGSRRRNASPGRSRARYRLPSVTAGPGLTFRAVRRELDR